MSLRPFALSASLLALSSIALRADQPDWQSRAASDPILQAMRAELDRSKSNLKLESISAPYYIEYRVIDSDQYTAEAAFGALRNQLRLHMRYLRVVVRIGDYKQDSYTAQGQGAVDIIPLDDDLLALRHQIWLATDHAYKEAAQSLTAKQAQLKQLNIEQPVDEFAHAQPVQSIEPLATLEFEPAPWLKTLEDTTALYKSDPKIEAFESSLQFSSLNRYLVNTEGTVVRSGHNLYEVHLAAASQAADGMLLERSSTNTVGTLKELPASDWFKNRASSLAAQLKELRDAPMADEEYRGPVLFSARAAATVFSELLAGNILGRRPPLGRNERTTGAFSASYKSHVLPAFLSVTDDPTLTKLDGDALLGHYEFDDEGVPAQKVSVIDHGTLLNYLIGREPIRGFPESNGHGRARPPLNAPAPSLGNLIVTADNPSSDEELKNKLLDLCKQRELAFAYYVDALGARTAPVIIHKVWAKDGHEELVRGATLGDLDIRALRSSLIAAGGKTAVISQPLNVPHSIASPAILFDELEVKRVNTDKEKLPEYPAP